MAAAGLGGAAMAAPVMGYDAIAVLEEEQHLRVPIIGRQRPAVAEHDGLTFAPVLVEDLNAVFGGDRVHIEPPFTVVHAGQIGRTNYLPAIARASTERVMQLLRSELQLPSAWTRRPSDWRLRLRPVAVGSGGIPPFEVGVDGAVFCRHQHPARFASPRSRADDCSEIVSCVEYLRSRHESGLLSRQVGREVLMKLRGVEVSETVCRLLYRSRLAEVAWEALSVVSLVLSSIRHVGRHLHQSDNRWIRPGFSNYRSPIAMSDKNARSILLSKGALRGSDIFLKGRLRLLDNADVVPILDKNVVHAFPARTVCPGTVNQNNIPNAMLFVLR